MRSPVITSVSIHQYILPVWHSDAFAAICWRTLSPNGVISDRTLPFSKQRLDISSLISWISSTVLPPLSILVPYRSAQLKKVANTLNPYGSFRLKNNDANCRQNCKRKWLRLDSQNLSWKHLALFQSEFRNHFFAVMDRYVLLGLTPIKSGWIDRCKPADPVEFETYQTRLNHAFQTRISHPVRHLSNAGRSPNAHPQILLCLTTIEHGSISRSKPINSIVLNTIQHRSIARFQLANSIVCNIDQT
jgi:hypothetical protein